MGLLGSVQMQTKMRGGHRFLTRVGGQGRAKRELSTSRPCGALFSQLQQSFYSEDQLALQETTKKLVEEVINPYAKEWEAERIFPAHKVFKKFGQAGLLGIHRDEEFGGQGLDYKYNCAFLEALGHSDSAGIAMAIGVQTDCSTPALANFGSDRLKREFLVPALAGDAVTSIAVSEPGGGSDVASLTTSARRVGGDLVINGTKMWITSGMQSDWACLLANTSEGKPHQNKSLIVVPMDANGITKSTISKMGMHASDTTILTFEDVRVPVEHIIGEEGMGFTYQMIQFQEERLAAAAGCLVPLSTILEETIAYTKDRRAFGAPLLDNQYIHFRLAELHTEVELVRAATYQAVDQMMAGENVTMLASMLKLKTGRLAREVTDSCLQFWGGMGFTEEVRVSRLYRDLRLWSIGGGADEVMLGIICKMMDILPKKKRSV